MQLSREDMLRELELVPMWHLRQPAAVPAVTSPVTMVAEPQSVQATSVVDATLASASMAAADTSGVAPEIAAPELQAASSPATFAPPQAAEENATQDAPAVFAETLPSIQSPWLVYCPMAEDADSQQLLQNILKAMQLPEGQFEVVQQPTLLAQTRVQYAVLFGLQAANTFLGAHYAQLAEVRGQVHQHGETQVVITHHPRDMLAQPALKKEVWFDLCLLLAKKV